MSEKKRSIVQDSGLVSVKKHKINKKIIGKIELKKKTITKIGEAKNFVTDYDSEERLISVYGKRSFDFSWNQTRTE